MGHKFSEIAFTPAVKSLQERSGSRRSYARFESGADNHNVIGSAEAHFISARDSFYMASTSETGWPYIQHRGGPKGFLQVLNAKELGFAELSGNRQFITQGNLLGDDRVSLFLMDYPNRSRLKIFGRARVSEDAELMARLTMPDYGAKVERAVVIALEAFDWNCPKHITPRYTVEELQAVREMVQ
jgi:predicted pyridoxine 5'-phosphate oxidase superfamily flavin-nucleotide-binding protein